MLKILCKHAAKVKGRKLTGQMSQPATLQNQHLWHLLRHQRPGTLLADVHSDPSPPKILPECHSAAPHPACLA